MTVPDGMDVVARAAELGIAVRPEWEASVRANLVMSLRLGAEVAGFVLEDDVETAPVYRP